MSDLKEQIQRLTDETQLVELRVDIFLQKKMHTDLIAKGDFAGAKVLRKQLDKTKRCYKLLKMCFKGK